MHNSLLLNRVTPYGEKIYMTLSAYLEVLLYYPVHLPGDTTVVLYCTGTLSSSCPAWRYFCSAVLYCTVLYWYFITLSVYLEILL